MGSIDSLDPQTIVLELSGFRLQRCSKRTGLWRNIVAVVESFFHFESSLFFSNQFGYGFSLVGIGV